MTPATHFASLRAKRLVFSDNSAAPKSISTLLMVLAAIAFTLQTTTTLAMDTTVCPTGFSESGRSDTALTCNYLGMVTGDLGGTPPSQTEQGRQLINDASLECRRVGTVVSAGSVGSNGVTLTCNVPLTPEEIAEIEREREEEAEREREREEEAEREREREEEAEREREREEEAEREREEEAERERERQEEAERERAREERAERERVREEEAQRERERQEAIRLEEEARSAPFTFDQPDEVSGRPTEFSVASGLVATCTSLRTVENPTPAQTDLLERCIDINREESNLVKASVLGQVAAKQYADIGQSLTFLNMIQVGNIGGRLAAITPTLRQNSKDVASSDLSHPDQGLLANSVNQGAQYGGAAGDETSGRFGVFVLGTKGDGEKDVSLLSNGFDYRSESMTVGIDYMFNASTVVGLAYGYGKTDSEFTGRTGRMDIDSQTVTLYGAKAIRNNLTLDAIIGIGDVTTDSERRMDFTAHGKRVNQLANSTIDSDQKLLSLGLTKSYETWLNIDVGARFNYIETDINRFSETIDASAPGFGLALEIDDYTMKSSTTDLSLNLSKAFSSSWGVVIPQARLSWVHEFESGDRVMRGRFLADTSTLDFTDSGLQISAGGGSTLFNVPLEQLDADYGNLLIGVNALLPNQFSLNASLNRVLGIQGFDHTYWSLSARKDF